TAFPRSTFPSREAATFLEPNGAMSVVTAAPIVPGAPPPSIVLPVNAVVTAAPCPKAARPTVHPVTVLFVTVGARYGTKTQTPKPFGPHALTVFPEITSAVPP